LDRDLGILARGCDVVEFLQMVWTEVKIALRTFCCSWVFVAYLLAIALPLVIFVFEMGYWFSGMFFTGLQAAFIVIGLNERRRRRLEGSQHGRF